MKNVILYGVFGNTQKIAFTSIKFALQKLGKDMEEPRKEAKQMSRAKRAAGEDSRQNLQEQAVTLRAEGKGFTEIAQTIGTNIQEAIDLTAEEQQRVMTLRGVQMEALFINNRADTGGRVQQLSQIRQRLSDELAQRSLADVPTEKLINLLIKLNESIKGEVNIPTIYSSGLGGWRGKAMNQY